MYIHEKAMYIHGRNRASATKKLPYAAALNLFSCKHYRLITVFCDDDCCTPYTGATNNPAVSSMSIDTLPNKNSASEVREESARGGNTFQFEALQKSSERWVYEIADRY